MIKKAIIALVLCSALALMAGCGSADENVKVPEAKAGGSGPAPAALGGEGGAAQQPNTE